MTAATVLGVVLVAAGLLVWPGTVWNLHRVAPRERDSSSATGRGTDGSRHDPFACAAAFDLFAVCLRAGLPVGDAASVVARSAPPELAEPLTRAAELLSLGADPEQAWTAAPPQATSWWRARRIDTTSEDFEALATMARRSARSGSSLAAGVAELAQTTRRRADDAALAAAERAGVAISGPLGLCFLPAFVCLGIVPVVIGLAGPVLGRM